MDGNLLTNIELLPLTKTGMAGWKPAPQFGCEILVSLAMLPDTMMYISGVVGPVLG
jgi:hypothetical protein